MRSHLLLIALLMVFCNAPGLQPAIAQDKDALLSEEDSRNTGTMNRGTFQRGDPDIAADEFKPAAADGVTSPTTTGSTYRDPVTGMAFVFVKGGCFQMGDIDGIGRDNERPVHEACVDDFYMGTYEVTQSEWETIMGSNPSSGKTGSEFPVNEVNWTGASLFASLLKDKTGVHFRLPTEAEWEYAARSGGQNGKWSGTNSEEGLKDFAWYSALQERDIHPVGLKKPNDLGLHDMAGNVKEWVADWYEDNYYVNSPKQNPQGPHSDIIRSWSGNYEHKVVRGGYFNDRAFRVRSSYRDNDDIDRRHEQIGFRLAIQITSEPAVTAFISFQPPIRSGDRVRIGYSKGKNTFIVTEIHPDGMMVKAEDEGAAPLFLRYFEIDDLEVSVARSPGQGAARGLWKGAVYGGVAGILISAGTPAMAVIGANWGLFAMSVRGASEPGDRWEELEHIKQNVDTQIKAAGMRNGPRPPRDPLAGPEQQYGSGRVAKAQEGAGTGLYLSYFIPVTYIMHDHHGSADYVYINSLNGGAGLGILAGYSFSNHIALEWSLSTTWHGTDLVTVKNDSIDNQLLTGSQLGIKYRIPLMFMRLEPYILGGGGYYWLGDGFSDGFSAGDIHYKGRGTYAGFGIEYPMRKDLSFTAGFTYKSIVFRSGSWIGAADVHMNAAALDIGFRHYFK